MIINLSRLVQAMVVLLVVFVSNPNFAQTAKQPSSQRWVIGSGVNLREQPNLTAPVLTRMALNTPVNLIAAAPSSKYCEVELLLSGKEQLRGFTACEYLSTSVIKPLEIANAFSASGITPNPNYNPERSFWLKPSYGALVEYGRYLERKRQTPKDEAEGIFLSERPKIAEFERMKAHLAKGIYVDAPAPYLRWDKLKTLARNAKSKPEYKNYDKNLSAKTINAIKLPAIASSYFQDQSEIAAPTTSTEKLAGKFQIIQTIQTKNYEARPKENKREWFGMWDISVINRSLTQAAIKNTLLRGGETILSEQTYLRKSELEYGNDDGVMCEGYEGDGFDFGDADPKISINYGLNSGHPDYSQPKKAGNKLMYFFTKRPLPQQTVSLNITKQKLNRATTGFVSSTTFHFDINSDGIPDLVVWEGVGIGPGHLDGPTKTDDAWFRAFFVNIAGHWHLLGKDTFSYGCGC